MSIRVNPNFNKRPAVTGLSRQWCQTSKYQAADLIHTPLSSAHAFASTKLQSLLGKLTSLRLITTRYTTGRGMLLTITICTVSCLSPSASSPFPLCFLQMRLLQRVTTFTSLTLQFLCRYCKPAHPGLICVIQRPGLTHQLPHASASLTFFSSVSFC